MIFLSQIDLGVRARSALSGIPALAEDIADKGLISPILLTKKTPELVTEYEAFYQTSLDSSRPVLLTCGGRRFAALSSLGVSILYPGTSCDDKRPGYIIREDTGLLDLLLIEGRENRNRQDLDWRDDMKLIVSAYRLAKQQANSEGEYLVMKDFACLLGVSHTHLGIAERIYDDYLSDPRAYELATSIYTALTIALRRSGDVAARVLLHRSLNQKPIIHEVKQEGGEIHAALDKTDNIRSIAPNLARVEVPSSTGPTLPEPVTVSLSQAFFNEDWYDFIKSQPEAFCDHIITDLREPLVNRIFFELAFRAISPTGYLAVWVPAQYFHEWVEHIKSSGFEVQPHPVIWNKIDYRFPTYRYNPVDFPQSYETCLLAWKPGSQLSQAQYVSVYTCSHRIKEPTFGPDYIPPEVFAWITKSIAAPGQIVYDPFARTGASAIGILSVRCRPIGTESDKEKYVKLVTNLKEYYQKQIPLVQFT